MAVNEIKGRIVQNEIKIIGTISKPIISKPLSAREGVVELIMLGTAYTPFGIIEEVTE